ncbi:hypothetical protein GS534_00985 [Rhodococcus hoagii]|nr:hypothetical protein [Prescottella equi]
MGWSIGFDEKWGRDIGYGVPACCDHPGCSERIDRGLDYVCGGEPYGGEQGCGLYLCGRHLALSVVTQQCERCAADSRPFEPSADLPEWLEWKLTDPSWAAWREANPGHVREMRATLELEEPTA